MELRRENCFGEIFMAWYVPATVPVTRPGPIVREQNLGIIIHKSVNF